MHGPGPFATLGKRAGLEGPINSWLAEGVDHLSAPVVLSGKGGGVRLLLEKPLMRPIKWIRRSWQGFYALLRMHHLVELLRDHLDDL